MTGAAAKSDMKAIAMMLACPHQWGPLKKVRVKDGNGKKEPRDGELKVCANCGTNCVKWEDGTGSMFPPQGLSP